MKLPSAFHGNHLFRRKRLDGDEQTRHAPGKEPAMPHHIRRAHGLETQQRFFLDHWLHDSAEK